MGRRNEGKSPKITQLWPHHRNMARMFAQGMEPGEVAAATGFSGSQISKILGSPLFQVELSRITAMVEYEGVKVSREIKQLAKRATEVLAENLYGAEIDRKLKTASAFDILDRAGYGKKIEVKPQKHAHLHLHKQVKEMDQRELLGEVMDMIEMEEDEFGVDVEKEEEEEEED